MARCDLFNLIILTGSIIFISTVSLIGCGNATEAPETGEAGQTEEASATPAAPAVNEAMVGTYDLDRDRFAADLQRRMAETDDQEAQLQMQLMLTTIDRMSMSVTLDGDGSATQSMTSLGRKDEATGTWTHTGEQITLTLRNNDEEEPNIISGTVIGETLRLIPRDDQAGITLIFTRRAEAATEAAGE